MAAITFFPGIHSRMGRVSWFLLLLLPLVDMTDEKQGKIDRGILDTGQVKTLKQRTPSDGNITADSVIAGGGRSLKPGSTMKTFYDESESGESKHGSTNRWQSLYPTLMTRGITLSRELPSATSVFFESSSPSISTLFSSSTRPFSSETTRHKTFTVTGYLPTSFTKRHRHMPPPLPTFPVFPSVSTTHLQSIHLKYDNESKNATNSSNQVTEKLVFSMPQSNSKKRPLILVEPPVSLPVLSASSSSAKNAGPYFESNRTTINVSAREGQNVLLDCAVALLQGRTVSWLRRRKDSLQLLTVGNTTYQQDSRLGLRFRYPNNWRLGIDSVTKADEGEYQCQLSTHPVLKTLIYRLKIIGPVVIILDENGLTKSERHYKVDSSLHLTCKSRQFDKIVENRLTWLKDDRPLPLNDKRTKVRFEKNGGNGELSAFLSVDSVQKSDSGNYTCRATSPQASSTIVVHVLYGELPAAVQHESSANTKMPPSNGILFAATTVALQMIADAFFFPNCYIIGSLTY